MKRKVIPFWSKKNRDFSNLRLMQFVVDGIWYSSVEMYVMYQKAVLFGDTVIAKQILDTANANSYVNQTVYKRFGRRVRNFDPDVWERKRHAIFLRGILKKFKQNPTLLSQLKETKGYILAESNPYDSLYGIGVDHTHPYVQEPSLWKGKNYCGLYLMIVRYVLCDCDYPDSTYGITQSKEQIDRSIAFVNQYL